MCEVMHSTSIVTRVQPRHVNSGLGYGELERQWRQLLELLREMAPCLRVRSPCPHLNHSCAGFHDRVVTGFDDLLLAVIQLVPQSGKIAAVCSCKDFGELNGTDNGLNAPSPRSGSSTVSNPRKLRNLG